MENLMKKIFLINILALFLALLMPLNAGNVPEIKPLYNKVYRTDRVGDSYHFLLLDKNGKYYYVRTNKTKILTPSEIKSPSILNILKEKQSWGQAFLSSGSYVVKNSKLYTKRYWDIIKVNSKKEIKYLNKIFHLQK
jgi:hypothetical protein